MELGLAQGDASIGLFSSTLDDPTEGALDGGDVAMIHPHELLARPGALLLVAGLARRAHEPVAATVQDTKMAGRAARRT